MTVLMRVILVVAAIVAPATAANARSCPIAGVADAAQRLDDCIHAAGRGEVIALSPGTYRLGRALTIDRPVDLTTEGRGAAAAGCGDLPRGRCATLILARSSPAGQMPLTVAADGVTVDHLIIAGGGQRPDLRAACARPSTRQSGGGLRVQASRFTLRKSVVRDVTCYSALEAVAGSNGLTVTDNLIGPNGDHRPGEIWSDGVTVHESASTTIRGNRFLDNTDVQLIMGGCRGCAIEGNRFRHSTAFSGGSFAELMIHSWPGTSGRYDGTSVRGNDVDCGPARNCGFGLMIGAAPWYPGRASGGAVTGMSSAMRAWASTSTR